MTLVVPSISIMEDVEVPRVTDRGDEGPLNSVDGSFTLVEDQDASRDTKTGMERPGTTRRPGTDVADSYSRQRATFLRENDFK